MPKLVRKYLDGQEREHKERTHPGGLSTAINPHGACGCDIGESSWGRFQRVQGHGTSVPLRHEGFTTRGHKMGIPYSVLPEENRDRNRGKKGD